MRSGPTTWRKEGLDWQHRVSELDLPSGHRGSEERADKALTVDRCVPLRTSPATLTSRSRVVVVDFSYRFDRSLRSVADGGWGRTGIGSEWKRRTERRRP